MKLRISPVHTKIFQRAAFHFYVKFRTVSSTEIDYSQDICPLSSRNMGGLASWPKPSKPPKTGRDSAQHTDLGRAGVRGESGERKEKKGNKSWESTRDRQRRERSRTPCGEKRSKMGWSHKPCSSHFPKDVESHTDLGCGT